MAAIVLTGFRGEQPKVIPRLLPPSAAQGAINVRLDDGGLTPFHQRAAEADADADVETILHHDGDWHTWDTVVHAVPGPVATDRLYFTGDGVPKMRVESTDYVLALAPPAGALTGTLTSSGSGDVTSRLYCYTWVTDFGEESAPSPASNQVDWQPGYTVTLSGFAATPSGRNITKQRIYRSQTGQAGTYFYLIDERAASNTDYVDSIAVDALQEPLPSADWNAPPDDMAGLIAIHGGMLAAFSGKELCFCEPYRPHAWPEKYRLSLDFEIVGLAAAGATVFVLTAGQPYLVTGSTPAAMLPVRVEANYPCVGARSIVDMGFAVAYASSDGLVVLRADGGAAIVSGALFDRIDWQKLSPQTMIGAQDRGLYVAFYDTFAGTTRLAGSLHIDVNAPQDLRRGDTIARCAFFDTTDSALYFVPPEGDIYRFDAPSAAPATFYWKSRPFILPAAHNFGVVLVDAASSLTGSDAEALEQEIADTIAANEALIAAGPIGGEINGEAIGCQTVNGDILADVPINTPAVRVGIVATGPDGVHRQEITVTNTPRRLKSGFRAEQWEIDVAANVRVDRIALASTMDELKALE